MLRQRVLRWSVIGMLAAGLLSGCSATRPYPNTLEKNLTIKTATDSGSSFSSVGASVDIYRIGSDCQTFYEGTVGLTEAQTRIGLPVGTPSYLVFVFSCSSCWTNSSGVISFDGFFTPGPGVHYDADVRYKDNMYNVVVRQKGRGKSAGREIELRPMSDCRPSRSR